MIARASWVGIALLAMLAATPCLAQEAPAPSPEPSPTEEVPTLTPESAPAQESPEPSPEPSPSPVPAAARTGAISGRGGVGGLIGGSYFYAADEYSKGALPRFDFSGHFRYILTPGWRVQVGPGFTWAAYSKTEPPPFDDIGNPGDLTKERYLALLVPISLQLQKTWGKSPWEYHLGLGPGIYRAWVENHRKVLVDPATYRLHRGAYLGFSTELGVERFLAALPNTSVEVSAVSHYVMATRDDQFPTGWNSSLGVVALRAGTNYYFDLKRQKKTPKLPGLE